MTCWKPTMPLAWSAAEMERILADALSVLAQVGVECAHEGARQRLAGWPGASISGERVRFAPAPVRDHVERMRARHAPDPLAPEPPFSLGNCWAGLTYCDPETQAIRPAAERDVIRMVRLWDARGLSGVVPVQPGDVPPALVTLAAERIALQHSRFLGGQLTVTDSEEVRYLIDMNLAAGRRYTLMEEVSISPLRLNPHGLDIALQFLGNPDVEVLITGAIPMAGVTCPLDPRSAIVQAVAERLVQSVLCEALGTDSGPLTFRVEPFDFQYSAIVFGSPEWCLYHALCAQMSEFLSGRPARTGRFRSTAKRPDSQAATERTASALWQALLGARHFGGVGQLSVDEVFSPQQAVLDREILQYVERLFQGIDAHTPGIDPAALIAEGVAAGSFVALEDTARRFRGMYAFPEIFRHWNLGRWRDEGEPEVLAEAWARAQAEIASSTFRLPEAQHREVDRVYQRAVRHVTRT